MSITLSSAIGRVDISVFLSNSLDRESCAEVAASLRQFGAVLVRDPRVAHDDQNQFVDLMEHYFAQPRHIKLQDARPELYYQVGVTPDGIERPRDNSAIAAALRDSEKPISSPSARQKDPKWRFFWRCGARPSYTDFPELNAAQVIPQAFKEEWSTVLDSWGSKLLQTIMTVAEMLAIGLGLPRDAVKEKLQFGPHLLAPTGADMELFANSPGTTIAGYHYDLNVLTIHGGSRYPGLFVWTRSGKRIPVVVPEGFLLIQSGVQLEYLTAGEILRGMHEVVVSEETRAAAKRLWEIGGSKWRVSSTLFAHVRSDASLGPLGHFADTPAAMKYSGVKAGEQVAQELRELELAS